MNQDKLFENPNAAMEKMLTGAGYSKKAINYIIEKPYMGTLPDADHISEMTGTCGDTMTIYLKIDNEIITDARYEVLGCPGAVSAAMAAVDLIKGKNLEDASKLNDGDIFSVLVDIPVKKHHCIQIAVKTLHKAIDEIKGRNTSETLPSRPACEPEECCAKKKGKC